MNEHTITPETAHALSLVGRVVTLKGHQYTVYCVEGTDYHAHVTPEGDISLAFLTPYVMGEARACILPSGTKLGDGYAQSVPVSLLRRGVSLAKTYR